MKINKPIIGTISETFLHAFSNSSKKSDIYELKINIGNREFTDYFILVDKDDIFDILIGIDTDTLKRNHFFLNLVDDYFYYVDINNNNINLSQLNYNINF